MYDVNCSQSKATFIIIHRAVKRAKDPQKAKDVPAQKPVKGNE